MAKLGISSKEVSVVIATRNTKKITHDCLESLKKTSKIKEIIVVDNASSDGTKKMLKAFRPKIKIIHSLENKGFAEANNLGYKLAKAKYVLFLNSDTIAKNDFLSPLVRALEKDLSIAAVQPLILFPNKTIDSVGSYITPTGFLYHKAHRQKPNKSNTALSEIYTLKGACMLWRKDVLEELGVFDESYFAYFEETELCHRAVNAGYKLLFTPKASIIHLGGSTSNTMNQAFIQFHSYKNRITTYIKHLPVVTLIKVLPLHVFLCQVITVLTFFKDPKTALAMQRGILQGLIKGFKKRLQCDEDRVELLKVMKKPDFSYYKALFYSLKGYKKIW